jgi:hypothetical protein
MAKLGIRLEISVGGVKIGDADFRLTVGGGFCNQRQVAELVD